MQPSKQVRYALIGAGNIAQMAVLPAFKHAKSNSVLAALISSDPEKRAELSKKYDLEHVGWQNKPFDGELTLDGNFGTFNTTQPGNSNQGHTYGADLSEEEQRALLEYLKTL